ncbi:transposase [Plectonema radiosum NIES-515]|uniref:Transposase n=1 Tax=Plectonema radiosum NIES-515 TaxID=2986073 RepID=A0ABT3AYU7_9CYAN|nr:transposase [Plectonema radiosum]MCV3214302.1 transposase [Plectonema radiosum NIES-515]
MSPAFQETEAVQQRENAHEKTLFVSMKMSQTVDAIGEWKLALSLTCLFDVLCFETLNLKGMQRLWGRKIGDLAFREFLEILEWVALKKGKQVVYIDPWYPSSKTCSCCGHALESLDLSIRRWRCPSCQSENDRDENASLNIKRVGSSTLGVGDVRQSQTAISV